MAERKVQYETTEGILLMRTEHATMAVHLTGVLAFLEAVIREHPDIDLGYATHYGGTTLDHYAVELTATADRIFLWTGADPFAKAELDSPVPAIRGDAAGVEA